LDDIVNLAGRDESRGYFLGCLKIGHDFVAEFTSSEWKVLFSQWTVVQNAGSGWEFINEPRISVYGGSRPPP
jgi:hypothetical protein